MSNIETQEALIREVWHYADEPTRKALTTKFAEAVFRAAEDSEIIRGAARRVVERCATEMLVPDDIKDSIQSRVRESLTGAVDVEARRVVNEVAKQAAHDFMARLNLRRY